MGGSVLGMLAGLLNYVWSTVEGKTAILSFDTGASIYQDGTTRHVYHCSANNHQRKTVARDARTIQGALVGWSYDLYSKCRRRTTMMTTTPSY